MLGLLLHGLPGTGKCLGIDTPVMMSDGSIKKVQDIAIGERLMGDDSTPRNVMSLARGREEMFRVIPTKGESFVVNRSHIMCLQHSRGVAVSYRKDRDRWQIGWCGDDGAMHYRNYDTEEEAVTAAAQITPAVSEVSMNDFLALPVSTQQKLKGYRIGVDFETRAVPLDPYILGYWLGDGATGKTQITTADPEIVDVFARMAEQEGLHVQRYGKYDYCYNGPPGRGNNSFREGLKATGAFQDKHVPDAYKHNDRETRLRLLAGIIDADGYYDKKAAGYDIIQKNARLAADLQYLCRSLGFAAYIQPCTKGCVYKGERRDGVYQRMFVAGRNLQDIPCKLERKQAIPGRQTKDPLRYGFDVQVLGIGDYYGFEIDGNKRFLLGDFTVTHNTSTIKVRNGCLVVGRAGSRIGDPFLSCRR